jgi:hypothetical protein
MFGKMMVRNPNYIGVRVKLTEALNTRQNGYDISSDVLAILEKPTTIHQSRSS